jgi:hypothetical protein
VNRGSEIQSQPSAMPQASDRGGSIKNNNNKIKDQKHFPVHVPGAVRTPVSPIAKCIRKENNLVGAI